MYAAKVIEAAIARYESKAGHKLIRISNDARDSWVEHLDKRVAATGGDPAQLDLTQEERLFIRNERVMCMVDFAYWSHYAMIQRDGGGITNFDHPWESTAILLRFIASIEQEQHDAIARGEMTPYSIAGQPKPAVPGILIALNKSRQLAACLTAGTPILTTDLRWTPIERISTGDTLVAFDETSGGKGIGRKLREATVLSTISMESETYRVVLDDGREICGTPHHRFLCPHRNHTDLVWRPLAEMQIGDRIRRVVDTWQETNEFEDGWFGGFLDGEGSIGYKSQSGAKISGDQISGLVWDRALAYLQKRGYDYRVEIDARDPKLTHTQKYGSNVVNKFCIGRMRDIFKLLGITRPIRLLSKPWWHGKELPNHQGKGFATVVSVSKSIVQRVYDLETTTGTYIADGLASHNTTSGRLITMHRLTTQRDRRALAASVDDDKIQEMYDRDKLVYAHLPWFLKPPIQYDEKAGHLHLADVNSRVLYQVSSQKSGIGVGRQIDIHHLTELSTWLNPDAVELDFFPTIPRSLSTFGLEESTPYGRGNWWHTWTEKVRKGHSQRWRYLFIPWYAELSKYRSAPPEGWRPSEAALLHAQKVHDTSAQYVGRTLMLPRENLYWWETTREEYRKGDRLNYFLTSYAATPEESFQHSTASAFPADFIAEMRDRTRPGTTYEIEAVRA